MTLQDTSPTPKTTSENTPGRLYRLCRISRLRHPVPPTHADPDNTVPTSIGSQVDRHHGDSKTGGRAGGWLACIACMDQ